MNVHAGLAPALGLTQQLLAILEGGLSAQPPVQLKRLSSAIARLVPAAASAQPLDMDDGGQLYASACGNGCKQVAAGKCE